MIDPSTPRSPKKLSTSVLATLFPQFATPSSCRNSLASTRKSSTGEVSYSTRRPDTATIQKKLSLNLKEVGSQILETAKSPPVKKPGAGSVSVRVLQRSPSASGTITSVRQSAAHRTSEIFTVTPSMIKGLDPTDNDLITDTLRGPLSCRPKKVVSLGGTTTDVGTKTARGSLKRGITLDLKTQATPRNRNMERTPKGVTFEDGKGAHRSVESRTNKKRVEAESSTPTAAVVKPKIRSEKDKKKRILSMIKVPTKYPDLEEKIKEFIIDSSFTDNIDKMNSASQSPPKNKQDFNIKFDERVTRNHNLNKSGMIWDVDSKQLFNKWFDEVIVKSYLERVEKMAEYLHLGPVDDSPVKVSSKMDHSSDPDARMSMIQEKAASLLEGFEHTFQEQGGTKHMCYHPTSFPEEFNRYLRDAKEMLNEDKSEEEEKEDNANMNMNMRLINVIEKAMHEKAKIRNQKNYFAQKKPVPVPDMLVELDIIKENMLKKFKPLYTKCKWNQKFENEFQAQRLDNVVSSTNCILNSLNTGSMLNFLRKNPKINQQREWIEQEEINKKYQNHPLGKGYINCTKLQNEINNMDKKLLEEIEYKIANEILSKFENDIEFISKGRTRFYKHKNYKKAQEIRKIDEHKAKEIALEEERKKQKVWSDRVRLMLKLNEDGNYTKTSKEVSTNPMLLDLNKTFSMISRAKDIVSPVDRSAVLRFRPLSKKGSESPTRLDRLANFTMEEDKPRTCRLSSVGSDIKDKPKLRNKLKRVYSGGPRGAPGRVLSSSMEKLQKAVLKLQSYTRGIVARKTYLDKQEKNEMIQKTKSLRVSFDDQ